MNFWRGTEYVQGEASANLKNMHRRGGGGTRGVCLYRLSKVSNFGTGKAK